MPSLLTLSTVPTYRSELNCASPSTSSVEFGVERAGEATGAGYVEGVGWRVAYPNFARNETPIQIV